MKNLFSGMLDKTRTVKGRIAVYDERLIFGEKLPSIVPPPGGVGFSFWTFSITADDTHIYSYRAHGNYLAYTRRSDIYEVPEWIITNVQTYGNSPISGYGDTVFYFDQTGKLIKNKYPFTNPIELIQPTSGVSQITGSPIEYRQLSAISDDEVFGFYRAPMGGTYKGPVIAKVVRASSTSLSEWGGRIYDKVLDTFNPFSAIKLNGVNYVYFSDLSQYRTYYIKEESPGHFSEVKVVVPMDTYDDMSKFYMSSASVINGKAIITGRLKRQNTDHELLVYLIGPEEFTFGRDMFIDIPQTEYQSDEFNGALFSFGGKLIYQTQTYKVIAEETTLIGNVGSTNVDGIDLPDTGRHINLSLGMKIGTSFSTPGTAQIDISPNDIANGLPAFRPGSVVRPEIFVDDKNINQWFSLGEYEIDGAIDPFEESERTVTLSLRQKSIRRLSQWTCDAPFDYWSQTKLNTNPKSLTEIIRVNGHWNDDGDDLKITELNEDNYFYANARPAKNTDVKAIFNLYELINTTVRVGVCVNFFSETRAQAAERLGVETSAVVESNLNKYSVMFWYDPRLNEAGVDLIGDVQTYELEWINTSATPPGEKALLRAVFIDGRLKCYLIPNYNPDNSFSYASCEVANIIVHGYEDSPWHRAELVEGDELGRGAVYMRAKTLHTKVYPFTSTDNYIPIQSAVFTGASGNVKIGSEIIAYGAKTNRTPFLTELDYAIGISLASYDGVIDTNQPFADLRSRNYIRQEFVIPDAKYVNNSTYCTGISIKAKKNFFPQDGLNLMLYDRNITVNTPLGKRKASKIVVSENISEEYGWVTAVFNVPVAVSKNYDHIICCRGEDANNPNSQAFYTAGLVSGNPYTGGRFFTFNDGYENGQEDVFTEIVNKDIPFKIYGTYDPPGGNYVVRVTRIAGLSTTTDFYKNMALYVTDGPGKGSTYFITGYVYGAEVCTFYLNRNPGSLTLGSKFIIVNTLYNLVRSNPLAHRLDEKIDLYFQGPYVGCENMSYFSTEQDKKLSDIARSICRKAGVLNFSERFLVDGDFIPNTNPVINNTLKNVIMEVALPEDIEGARLNFRNGAVSIGFERIMYTTQFSVYFNDVWKHSFSENFIFDKPIVISLHDNFLSLWSGDSYIFSIPIPETEVVEPGITLSGTSTLPVHIWISELSYRVDNFLLDIGTTGLQLLDRLIDNKMYYYLDDGNGGIKMFRSHTEANTEETPYKLSIALGRTDIDASIFSRIRVEGAEAKETVDIQLMKEYGNIYKTVNINEINNMDDAEYFSKALIEDARDRTEIVSLVGSADPRLEPKDIIYARILKRGGGYEDKKIIIDEITLQLGDSSDVIFDMNINGRIDK